VTKGAGLGLNAGDVMRKTMLIFDASVFVRHALYELFTRQADFDKCGAAENGREAVEVARHLNPDLIVLELSMPAMNGRGCCSCSETHAAYVFTIMYSTFEDSFSKKQAKLIGISEIVSKSDPPHCCLRRPTHSRIASLLNK
jgi:DNA-binding NarL/FixJ family response regulator